MSLPSKAGIARYWALHAGEHPFVTDYGEPCCFACHYYRESWDDPPRAEDRWNKAPLERAHLVPSSLGGSDRADNLVLLCRLCHEEAPDLRDPAFMLAWIERRPPYWVRRVRQLEDACREQGLKDSDFVVLVDRMEEAKTMIQSEIEQNATTHPFASSGDHLAIGTLVAVIASVQSRLTDPVTPPR